MKPFGKIIAGAATAITTCAVYEIAVIGMRAFTEDAAFLNACRTANKMGKGKKVKKLLGK